MLVTTIAYVANFYSATLTIKNEQKSKSGTADPNLCTSIQLPVPWWNNIKDTNCYILLTSSDKKYTFYIWQNGQSVYYSVTQPKTLTGGTPFPFVRGGNVLIVFQADGTIAALAM
jgi:hypothetical protein